MPRVHLLPSLDPIPTHRDTVALCSIVVRNAESQELEPGMGQKLELKLSNLCNKCRKAFEARESKGREFLYALTEGKKERICD